ncbi:MAG: alpha amylase C-terminal domain-containing protein [Chloroflexota bacterium]
MLRKDRAGTAAILVVCNFATLPRFNYRVGVPLPGLWTEVLNSDAREYGGSGLGNMGSAQSPPNLIPRPARFARPHPAAAGSHIRQEPGPEVAPAVTGQRQVITVVSCHMDLSSTRDS